MKKTPWSRRASSLELSRIEPPTGSLLRSLSRRRRPLTDYIQEFSGSTTRFNNKRTMAKLYRAYFAMLFSGFLTRFLNLQIYAFSKAKKKS